MKPYRKVLTFSFWIHQLFILTYHWVLMNKTLFAWKNFFQALPPGFTLELIDALKIVRPWTNGSSLNVMLKSATGKHLGMVYFDGTYFVTLPDFSVHGKANNVKDGKFLVEKLIKDHGWKFQE